MSFRQTKHIKKGYADAEGFTTAVQCIAAYLLPYLTLRSYFRNLGVWVLLCVSRMQWALPPYNVWGPEILNNLQWGGYPTPWRTVLSPTWLSNSPLDAPKGEMPIYKEPSLMSHPIVHKNTFFFCIILVHTEFSKNVNTLQTQQTLWCLLRTLPRAIYHSGCLFRRLCRQQHCHLRY